AGQDGRLEAELAGDVEGRLSRFLEEAKRLDGLEGEIEPVVATAMTHLKALAGLLARSHTRQAENVSLADEAAESPAAGDAGALLPGEAGSPTPASTNGHANGTSAGARRDITESGAAGSGHGQLEVQLPEDRPEVAAALLIWALTRPLG